MAIIKYNDHRTSNTSWGGGPRAVALLAGAVLVAGGVAGLWWKRQAPTKPVKEVILGENTIAIRPRPTGEFVGSQACTECHDEIAEAYKTHPMSRSLYTTHDVPPLENYEENNRFAAVPFRHYEVVRGDKSVVHREVGVGVSGKPVYRDEVPITHVVGSGVRGRSYLLEREGHLFVSAISWYAKNNSWGLSPGYTPGRHQRFSRPATDRCLACHSGRLHQLDGQSRVQHRKYGSPSFLEHAIGCESCHGPGKDHVEYQEMLNPAGEDPIVSMASLTSHQRDSVCVQCHLLGDHQVLRFGRDNEDFRPGDALGDIWSIFLEGNRLTATGTEAVSQVEQMYSSKCYQGDKENFGCATCHDPHLTPSDEERVAFYRTRCLACHEQEQDACSLSAEKRAEEENSCIVCHMPQLAAFEIPHTSQTDHRIVRTAGQPTENSGSQGLQLFDRGDMTDLELERARGIMLAERSTTTGDRSAAVEAKEILNKVIEKQPRDVAVYDALGVAHSMLEEIDDALLYFDLALQVDPNHRESLRSLVTLHQHRQDHQTALPYLNRLLELEPWKAELHARKSAALADTDISGAIDSAKTAVRLDPSSTRQIRLLIELLRESDRNDETAKYRQVLEGHWWPD